MRTTEPDRWQELLDKVSKITPETLEALERMPIHGYFYLFGQHHLIYDRNLCCTIEGLNRQLDEFSLRNGIVYYLDETTMSLAKAAFVKTWEEQYGDKTP